MAWPKGKPRPEGAGRKKGTPNKNSLDLLRICEEKGVDVFAEMVSIAMTTTLPEVRFKMFSQIAEYLYPKRKALEHSGHLGMEWAKKVEEIDSMTKEDQVKLLESELKRLKGA